MKKNIYLALASTAICVLAIACTSSKSNSTPKCDAFATEGEKIEKDASLSNAQKCEAYKKLIGPKGCVSADSEDKGITITQDNASKYIPECGGSGGGGNNSSNNAGNDEDNGNGATIDLSPSNPNVSIQNLTPEQQEQMSQQLQELMRQREENPEE